MLVEEDRFLLFFLIVQRKYYHFSGRAAVTVRNALLLASRFGKPAVFHITSAMQYVVSDYYEASVGAMAGFGGQS